MKVTTILLAFLLGFAVAEMETGSTWMQPEPTELTTTEHPPLETPFAVSLPRATAGLLLER